MRRLLSHLVPAVLVATGVVIGPLTTGSTAAAIPASSGTDTRAPGSDGPAQRHWARVVKVTDGDTLAVRIVGVGVRSVRILGIDTPEVYGGSECGGEAASAHMARLAPVGSRVRLVSDPGQADRDRYGRWLRYVSRDRRDVGREMILHGYARVYVYDDDPFRRTAGYRRAEAVARTLLRGSWALCW